MSKPTARQLIDCAGISRTHAYDILSGKQTPSLGLALKIRQATGWKPDSIANLADETLDDLSQARGA